MSSRLSVLIFLIIACAFATVGQIFFKKWGIQNPAIESSTLTWLSLLQHFINPNIVLGLLFYGLGTLLWIYCLSKVELNFAYPFTILTYILVMAASYFIFKEPFSTFKILGSVLVISGIVLIALDY